MFKGRILAFVSTALVLSCGASTPQVISNFSYTVDNNVLDVKIDFNSNFQLNTSFIIPILQYGSVSLTPSTKTTGFSIGATLNLDYLNDGSIATLNKTQTLPNNQPMSDYVTEPVAQIRVKDSDLIYSDIYLGLDLAHMYVGTALELGYIDQHFPAGLVISQKIPDKQGRIVGVVTIFGPNVVNGQVVRPGGFFFMTNATDLIKFYGKTPTTFAPAVVDNPSVDGSGDFFVNEPYRSKFSSPYELQKLFKIYKKQGKKAGLID